MKTVTDFPRRVRVIENVWIPVSDGCRLAARIWLPEDADERPVPAVIEYIPYRKRDGTRWRDEPMHHYFAGHGYAAVRVDLRGSGDSDGLLLDEYLEQEQIDGVEAIRWIARQPWCNGAVGMMGKSWGGFNSLQIAALRPPELKAVLSVCSTDDRYADDAHYMGGCLLNENVVWGSVLFTLNALPPDPAVVGPRWREMWSDRLDHNVLFPEIWLRHPLRDDYWRHGSVSEDFDAIECPVYCVGGWADGYTNAVPRMLAGLSCPRKGLIGPWAHVYPHEGVPGPAMGFLQEALLWWDHWLKGIDRGIMDEPQLRVWMQDGGSPEASPLLRPGRWVAERRWPSERVATRRLHLGPGELRAEPAPTRNVDVRSVETTGLQSGSWCGFGTEGEMPGDQAPDDAKSVVFDSAPVRGTLEILGAPVVELSVSVDRPRAFLAVRLNDVAPGGSSARVTYGLLNLTHDQDHRRAAPLVPGRRRSVRVRLGDAAHTFRPGHRIRLAVSTAYWPVAWPSPEAATVTIHTGDSALLLPVRPPDPADARLRPFGEPEGAPEPPSTDHGPAGARRTIENDTETGETVVIATVDLDDLGRPVITHVDDIDLDVGHGVHETFRIREGDPLSARSEIVHRCSMRRGEWTASVDTRIALTATRDEFVLEARLEAADRDGIVRERAWKRKLPRIGL